MTIKGLDELQRQLKEAERALASLDGTIATIKFDPSDSASVQGAIRQMEQAVDAKVSRWRTNPIVSQLATASKSAFRDKIRTMSRNRDAA